MAHSKTNNYTASMAPDIIATRLSPEQSMIRASQAATDQPPKQGHGISIQSKPNENENRLHFPKETDCDITSAKRVFGWTTLDGVNLPFIIRRNDKYLSVRMLEAKLLSNFPSNFALEIDFKLVSHRITFNEQSLLNEINVDHCNYEYGKEPFTGSDIIVQLDKFQDFYQHVKETFPEEVTNSQCLGVHLDSPRNIRLQSHGWIQINNTVTPYVRRQNKKYALLPVLTLAAGLLTDGDFPVDIITEVECAKLNTICANAGFDFRFDTSTQLVDIGHVKRHHHVTLLELPMDKPVENAKYGITHELLIISKECTQNNSVQQRAHLQLTHQQQVLANTHSYQAQQSQLVTRQVDSQLYPDQSLSQQELSNKSHRPLPTQWIHQSPYQGKFQLQQQQQQQQQHHAPEHGQPTMHNTRLLAQLLARQRRPPLNAHEPVRQIHPPHHRMEEVQSRPQQMLPQMQLAGSIWPSSQQKQTLSMREPSHQLQIPEQYSSHSLSLYKSQQHPHSIRPSTLRQLHPSQNRQTAAMLLQQKSTESQLRHQFQIPHQQHPFKITQKQVPSAASQMLQQEYILQQANQDRFTFQSNQTCTISPSFQNTSIHAKTVFSVEPFQIPDISTEINSNSEFSQPCRAQPIQPTLQESTAHRSSQYHDRLIGTTSTTASVVIRTPPVNEIHSAMDGVQNNMYHSSLHDGAFSPLTSLFNSKSCMTPEYQSIPRSSTSITNSHECAINDIASDNIRLQPHMTNPQVQHRPLGFCRPQEHDAVSSFVVPRNASNFISSSRLSGNMSTISSSSINNNVRDFRKAKQIPSYIATAQLQVEQKQLPKLKQQPIQHDKQLQLQQQSSDTDNLQHTRENLPFERSLHVQNTSETENCSPLGSTSKQSCLTKNTQCNEKIQHFYSIPKIKVHSVKLVSNSTSSTHPVISTDLPHVSRADGSDHTHSTIVHSESRLSHVMPGKDNTAFMVTTAKCSPHLSASKTAGHTNGACYRRTLPVLSSESSLIHDVATSSSTSIIGDKQTDSSQVNVIVRNTDEGPLSTDVTDKCTPIPLIVDQAQNISNSMDTVSSYAIPCTTRDNIIDVSVRDAANAISIVTDTNRPRQPDIIPDASSTGHGEPDIDITITKVENLSEISKMVHCIHLVKFYGKALSCLDHHSRKGKYVLIKAMRNLYFPMINLSLLEFFIEKVFKIPTVKCSSTEERAFNQYYGLSIVDIKCDKMVELFDLKKRFIWLCKFLSSKKDNKLPSPCYSDKLSKSPKNGGKQCVTKVSNDINKIGLMTSSKKRKVSFEGSDFHCHPKKHMGLQQESCNLDSSCITRTPLATIFTERNSQ